MFGTSYSIRLRLGAILRPLCPGTPSFISRGNLEPHPQWGDAGTQVQDQTMEQWSSSRYYSLKSQLSNQMCVVELQRVHETDENITIKCNLMPPSKFFLNLVQPFRVPLSYESYHPERLKDIFSDHCSCYIIGQQNTLRGKCHEAIPPCISSQTLVMGCRREWVYTPPTQRAWPDLLS